MTDNPKNNSADWSDIDDFQNPLISQSTSAPTDLTVALNEGADLNRLVPDNSKCDSLIGNETFNKKGNNNKP